MFFTVQSGVQRLPNHPTVGRLIDRIWLAVDPPSQRLLLSLSSCLRSSSALLCSLALSSIAGLRSPTRHRQQGCSEGAAQPENGTTTRPVDLSILFRPVLPASFSRVVAVPSLKELPGEWRWVSWWVMCSLVGCAPWWRIGEPHPVVPLAGEGAAETAVKCSARLWIMHKEKRGKGERGRGKKLYVTFFFSEHIDIKFVWHIHTGNPAMLKIE